jgi:thioredoxin-dependent peroxiredoxin
MATAPQTLDVGETFPVDKLGRPLDGPAVVYFYPADFTRGCTIEAQAFNGLYDEFRALGIEVIGVSTQDEDSHAGFVNECGLRFPLVADPDAELTRGLGLLKEYGEHGEFARRVTFLLDKGGIVRNVWTVEDAAGHPAEVLEAARGLAVD